MQRFMVGLSILSLVMLASCNRSSRVEPAAAIEAEGKTAQEREASQARTGVVHKLAQLYDQAKATKESSAKEPSTDEPRDWVDNLVDKAKAKSAELTDDGGEWVRRLYHEAKQAGQTTAGSTREWILDDLRNTGSWQYKVVTVSEDDSEATQAQLNELGRERWECFHVQSNGMSSLLYFKRKKRSYLSYIPLKDLVRLLPHLTGSGEPSE